MAVRQINGGIIISCIFVNSECGHDNKKGGKQATRYLIIAKYNFQTSHNIFVEKIMFFSSNDRVPFYWPAENQVLHADF
jgi:hypothetical protein